jgi:hypothetical protein
MGLFTEEFSHPLTHGLVSPAFIDQVLTAIIGFKAVFLRRLT